MVAVTGRVLAVVTIPLLAVVLGVWVYRDARARGRGELAPWLGLVVGGLFITGSVPGLVALAVAGEASAVQGFPTAIRVIPGIVALLAYLYFR
jgi:hypothetical protein